jgi:hypothetical protein
LGERVKSETSELAKTIQDIESVKPAISITNLCGLTLEKLDQSVSILKQAARGGLLEQAETTDGCFDNVFDWIEKSYGKSPIRPFDVLKHNQLIIVRSGKKALGITIWYIEKSAKRTIYRFGRLHEDQTDSSKRL